MKILCTAVLAVAIPFIAVNGQVRQNPGAKIIEYQSPYNGERDVNEQTTLIVRPVKSFMAGKQATDFAFSVKGEQSGMHRGTTIIAAGGTIIFQPEALFALNEN